jgi:small subunit ribosomal protein S6
MRKYESVIVFAPELQETQVKQEIKKFEGILAGKGVSGLAVDSWGKKDLAHAVKKAKQGRYVCLKYEASDYQCVDALNSLLRISESVLKFQTHRVGEATRKFKGNPKRKGSDFDDDFSDVVEMDY